MRVLMAMSGGIDSTAAALLLREQGCEIIGCTFRTRYTRDESIEAAVRLAQNLGIEHHVSDYSERFETEVVTYFRAEYLAGRTPNPCVVCNRRIKFGLLMDEADRLGCECVATGHYAQVNKDGVEYFLERAKDATKDQTYFLWQLNQQQLSRVMFPLGHMTKSQVRDYLAQKGYVSLSQKGESQDICFIEDDYRTFLNLPDNPGNYVDESGRVLGRHKGYTNYTIGQRKGLGIALGTPAFVGRTDAERNEVMLTNHDALFTDEVRLRDVTFRGDDSLPVMAQIRYRSKGTRAFVRPLEQAGEWRVLFDESVWAVTPGQSCVFYRDNRLVGGGIIE